MKKFLLILFVLPLLAHAQTMTVTRPVAGTASTTASTTYTFTAFTPTANALLVAFVSTNLSSTSATMTSTAGATSAWTKEGSQTIASTGNTMHIFWAKVTSAVSTTVTFTASASSGGTVMTMFQIVGADITRPDPIDQIKFSTATTTSTAPALTFTNTVEGSSVVLLGWVGGLNTANVSTPPTGFTEADDINFATPNTNLGTAYKSAGFSSAGPFTFTGTSTAWVTMGVEIGIKNKGMPLPMMRRQ